LNLLVFVLIFYENKLNFWNSRPSIFPVSRPSENPSFLFLSHLSLNLVSVFAVDHLLNGGRNENVALFVHQILALVGLGAGKTDNRAMLELVVLQLLRVNALIVVDGAIMLDNARAQGTRAGQIAAGVQADITEALNDERFATPSGCGANHRHVVGLVDEILQTVEHTTTRGRHTTMDAALVDWLARDTGVRIDIGVTDRFGVRVGDPRHFTFAGTHVGGGHINARADEALLRQLQRKATRDLFEFVFRVLFGVDFDAGLAATEWHINAGALECHQGGQGFHLVA
jgi:hypothetical protein